MGEIDGHAEPVPTGPEYTPDDGDFFNNFFEDLAQVTAKRAARASTIHDHKEAAEEHANGPGFAFDHDKLMSLAGRWEDLATGFKNDSVTARNLQDTQPPGNEYASANNAKATQDSGAMMQEGLKARADYCTAQAEKFRKAAGEYQKADEDAASGVGQYGGIV